jgi:hypothetical protein
VTALVYREDDRHVTVIDEDDGCLPGRHERDALCARTPLKKLAPAEPEAVDDGREGGPT